MPPMKFRNAARAQDRERSRDTNGTAVRSKFFHSYPAGRQPTPHSEKRKNYDDRADIRPAQARNPLLRPFENYMKDWRYLLRPNQGDSPIHKFDLGFSATSSLFPRK